MDVVRYNAHHVHDVLTSLSLLLIPILSTPLLHHSDGSKDNDGDTALSCASAYGFTDVVRDLIAADGSVEHLRMKDNEWGETALIAASINGWADIVRELIAADGSVEHVRMQSRWGKTALDKAKNDEIKALLRAAGAQEAQTQ